MKIKLLCVSALLLFAMVLQAQTTPTNQAFEIFRNNFNKTLAKKLMLKNAPPVWLYGYYESDHSFNRMAGDSLFISFSETDEAPKRDDLQISYDYGDVHTKLHNYTFALKDILNVSGHNSTDKSSDVGYIKIETLSGVINARLLFLEASYEIHDPSWEGGSSTTISAAIMDDKQQKLSVFLLPYLKNDIHNELQLVKAIMEAAGK
jgi:hypothetical protein